MKWRSMIVIALLGVLAALWQMQVRALVEQVNSMRERIVELERYRDEVPAMFRVELAAHRKELIEYWEVRLGR